jgi:polysaccharide biosynthesis protein PelA
VRLLKHLLAAAAFFAFVPSVSASMDRDSMIKREIFALYDGDREPTPTDTRIHRFAEMPLNHLGYIVHFHDVRTPLPTPNAMTKYRGLLTWFTGPIQSPKAYIDWAEKIAGLGIRFTILGDVGVDPSPDNLAAINRVLATIGIAHTGESVDLTFGTRIVSKDPGLIEFERELDPVLPFYPIVRLVRRDVETALELESPPTLAGPRKSAVVVLGPNGGFAALNYELYIEPDAQRVRWAINPFAFFARAFGDQPFPIPDTTTVSGRRLYYSHVDGDGWNSEVDANEMARFQGSHTRASEVLRKELIGPYPDLPVTVGIVAGDIRDDLGGDSIGDADARAIFALPQVEIGSHTLTHPSEWSFFENYDRAKELRLAGLPASDEPAGIVSVGFGLSTEMANGHQTPRHAADLPRVYLNPPFNVDAEVFEALRLTEALAPAGKRAMLYQWSGDERPFEQAIAATRAAGVRNLNGGETSIDADHPSLAYVAPLSRSVGEQRQIYSGNSNENSAAAQPLAEDSRSDELTGVFSATETPRRLKGVDIYYHAFSVAKKASLNAVKRRLEIARRASLAPISASHYAAIADAFFDVQIIPLGDKRWSISNRSALQTVRFDDASSLEIDADSSSGILGSNRTSDSLYVALDAAVGDAVVALRARTTNPTLVSKPSLVESRWLVEGLVLKACGFSYNTHGFGSGEFLWEGLRPGRYAVVATRTGQSLWHQTINVESDGRVALTVPIPGLASLSIDIDCLGPATAGDQK